MNSERLKDFRQAAYDLLVKALLCNIRADGCSDDYARMRHVLPNQCFCFVCTLVLPLKMPKQEGKVPRLGKRKATE